MTHELLNVQNLHAGYGRIPVLFGIDLTVNTGEIVGILGHNGMGKSTFLRALMGHVPATKGAVSFDDRDLTAQRPAKRAQAGLGYVPQGRQIFPALSVMDNMRVAAKSKPKVEAEHLIEGVIEDLPRLKPVLTRTGGVLSGGEQQILALARCLCTEPKLILLDEPTEGIQPSIIEEMVDVLHRLCAKRGLSILLVEQNLEFIASLASRVLPIRRGQLSTPVDPETLHNVDLTNDFTV